MRSTNPQGELAEDVNAPSVLIVACFRDRI